MKKSAYLDIPATEIAAIQSLYQRVNDPVIKKRLQALLLMTSGKAPAEIVEITGFTRNTIYRFKVKYLETGLEWFKTVYRPNIKGRPLMPQAEEVALFQRFHALAETGKAVTACDVRRAIEEKIGRPISRATVYLMLNRQGWGQIKRQK